VKAASFNTFQQGEGIGLQAFQSKALRIQAFSSAFNKLPDMFRDQEAGGSNPLAPTFYFSKIQPVSEPSRNGL
jgi:hypothetical protein